LRSHPPSANVQPLPLENRNRSGFAGEGVDPEYVTVFSGARQPVEVYLNRGDGAGFMRDAYYGRDHR